MKLINTTIYLTQARQPFTAIIFQTRISLAPKQLHVRILSQVSLRYKEMMRRVLTSLRCNLFHYEQERVKGNRKAELHWLTIAQWPSTELAILLPSITREENYEGHIDVLESLGKWTFWLTFNLIPKIITAATWIVQRPISTQAFEILTIQPQCLKSCQLRLRIVIQIPTPTSPPVQHFHVIKIL